MTSLAGTDWQAHKKTAFARGKDRQYCTCLFNDGNGHVTNSNEVRKFVVIEKRQKDVDIHVNTHIEKLEKLGGGARRVILIDVYRSSHRTF